MGMMKKDDVKNIIELIKIFENAKENFLKDCDKIIIATNINERTLTARLMYHLQKELDKFEEYKEYSVDCEYNRNNYDVKYKKYNKTKIYPDIIIHKRLSNENLIALEMKKIKFKEIIDLKDIENKKFNNDRTRLEDFTAENGNFKYALGIFFIVDRSKKKNHIVEFYSKGKKMRI